MDFSFTAEDEAFRKEVSSFIEEELPSDLIMPVMDIAEDFLHDDVWDLHKYMAHKLGQKGWLAISWPEEWGGSGANPIRHAILLEELMYKGTPGWDPQGVGMVGPIIIRFGTEEQKRKYLPPISRGESFWCQGYSEPGGGSDLAALQTKAIEQDEYFIINGQKLWTSGAHVADYCHLLARTDPNAPKKHQGISYFLVDMKTPGISVRRITTMDKGRGLCEVYFTDVKVPRENILGEKNQGWQVAMSLLDTERAISLGSVGVKRGIFDLLVEYVKESGMSKNDLVQQRLAQMTIEIETSRLLCYRIVWLASQGLPSPAETSMAKLYSSELNQRIARSTMMILGLRGQLEEGSKWSILKGRIERWYLSTFGSTLLGGTSEIQRNILAMLGLGLPRN